jgi:Flp pilus assembly pilin Flp
MHRLKHFSLQLLTDESGVDLVEFAVAGGFIAASAVVTMKDLRADMLNAGVAIWHSITSDF